jgi:two-component system, NtrC family, nitrogen regulation sensor histidine kinase GlnL
MSSLLSGSPTGQPPAQGFDPVVNALPVPVVLVGAEGRIEDANVAAEAFFEMGRRHLKRATIARLCGETSPVLHLISQVREGHSAVAAFRVDFGMPRQNGERLVDVHAAPLPEKPGVTLLMLQEQTTATKFSRQLTHRDSARSVSAMSAMLAHEIKNPLSGIRGAAQLLDDAVSDDDRLLTRLIRDETDRIVKLVDRFEMFSDGRPPQREEVNIHAVLDRVRQVASTGFARHIRIVEDYDPSLPPVSANGDQLIQIYLNLVKNAAEAIGPDAPDGEIHLSTAYRSGLRVAAGNGGERVRLPLEVCVRDNGPGVPDNILPNLFDPFVTGKASGNGLGLALVAKLIGDHGGVVECESLPRRTVFRTLLPIGSGVRQQTG